MLAWCVRCAAFLFLTRYHQVDSLSVKGTRGQSHLCAMLSQSSPSSSPA